MADVTQAIRLLVEASTDGAEASFRTLTDAAEGTGKAAKSSADDVTAAANRVLAAQARQADAAGQVRVAMTRQQELQESGRASATQLAAAEEKVEAAQRKLHMATRDATDATEAQEHAQRQATDATRDAERADGDRGKGLFDLQGKLGGLLAGGALVAGFHAVTDAAEESARIGARTSNVITQTGQAAGLSADQVGDLAGAIAAKTGVDDEAIQSGANLLLTFTNIKDAAGKGNDVFSQATALMTDMSAAMGTDASASAVQLGKALNDPIKGVTALSKVGVSFTAEQKEQIRTLVESGNIMGAQKVILGELSKEFGGAAEAMSTPMDRARVVVGNLAETIGGGLLPIVDVGAHVLQAVAEVAGSVPLPMGLAAGAAILLGVGMRSAAAEGGLMAGAMSTVQGASARFTGAVAAATVGSGAFATAAGAARLAGGGLMTALGGPLGLAIIGLGAGFALLNKLTGSNSAAAKDATQANSDLAAALRTSNGVVTDAVRQQAAQSAQQAGLIGTAKALGLAQGTVTDAILGNGDAYKTARKAAQDYIDASLTSAHAGDRTYTENAEKARGFITELDRLNGTTSKSAAGQAELAGELGQTADAQSVATAATEALTDAIDSGETTGQAFTDLVRAAAAAQDAQSASSDRAKASVDAYRATTDQAVQSTLSMLNATLSAADAHYGFQSAMDAAAAATDDEKTSVDEVAEAHTKLQAAALRSATASADAAVASAKANGVVMDAATEASTRADAMLADLRASLATPGLTDQGQADIQAMIDKLQTAKDKGDVQATITLTGTQQVATELDDTTEDRTATVQAESRGGPAVISYLDGIAEAKRLAIINVESRGGPAVDSYLDGLRIRDRLAIINVESRGGPAVDGYLDGIAGSYRLAIINVETRGGPAVARYLDDLAGASRTAVINVRRNGSAGAGAPAAAGFTAPAAGRLYGAGDVNVQQLTVQVTADSGGRLTQQSLADAGRQYVTAIRRYEQHNGTGWRR